MDGLKKVGNYIFLESQEDTISGATWRAAELEGGKIKVNFLADVIKSDLAADKGFTDTYIQHSASSVKLEHPNILKKHQIVREGGETVGIYEYLEGFSLAKVLERCQNEGFPFSIDHGLLVVSKILSALAHAKGKHLNHGFLNPSAVMITTEGEVKIRGFAFSAALRAANAPQINPWHRAYLPAGQDLSYDSDRADVYGCGAILFEMLTGQKYNDQQGEAAAILANATLEADGEQIPTPIANILLSALDPSAPSAYADVLKMSKDMEELLYSGEYSPTTFNLAFFMHSAFRTEMEEMGEKLAAEKGRDYSDNKPPPRAAAAAAAAPVAASPAQAPVEAVSSTSRPDESGGGKSKMPIIIGVAAIVIIAIGVFFMMGRGEPEQDKFAAERAKLEQTGKDLEAERLKTQQDELARQNELLREQLREQARQENARKKRELEEEMTRMDEEIRRLKALKEQEQKQKEIETKLAELEQQRQQAADEERLRQEAEQQRIAAEAEAQRLREEEAAKAAEEAAAKAAEDPVEAEPEADANAPAEAPAEVVNVVAPNEGDLVPLDDPYLQYPSLVAPYPPLKAPRKAVRDGVVKRDKMLLYLMRALVDENGSVTEAIIQKSPVPNGQDDYGMGEKAIRHAKKIKFNPGTKMGVRVKVWMIISVHFKG